ncbi:MAG TPA: SH3 domain-containing protein [Methylophilaceae bacterium]|nr:SH3 domain-containing protein [Methylophilaceae bacterium]
MLKFPLAAVLIAMLLPNMAAALEYRAIAVPKAILYDAPSAQGKKLYVIGQGYPVEVIVNLGDWIKVRDNQGGLSWIDAKQLTNARTLLVVQAQSELRQSADASSTLLGRLEKDVVLDYLEPAKNGWVKVKHKDGLTGYVPSSSVWGL